MKNYVVSTLISLALASPFALAEEVVAPQTPEVTTTEIQIPEHIAKAQAEAKARMEAAQAESKARMEAAQAKSDEHHKAVQALMEKMGDAKTQEERQALMQQRMELMQKHYREMQKFMRPEMPAMQNAPVFPPQMSEEQIKAMQERMEAAQKYRAEMYSMYNNRYEYPTPPPYYGGYAPRYDYPPMPPRMMNNRGKHCDMKSGAKHDKKKEMMEQKKAHHQKMQQSMQNIEAALKEMLEIMKAK